MVDIDYDLIPLEADKTEEVARNARILARSGKVPPISPTSYGRVVVVNPDENFTIHQDYRRTLGIQTGKVSVVRRRDPEPLGKRIQNLATAAPIRGLESANVSAHRFALCRVTS
ncbi:MAG: hypothetical protein IIA41_09680 [SAR324 cluster bacterium]|nr:hypothetical protein [SAR324 cluster bacterium]